MKLCIIYVIARGGSESVIGSMSRGCYVCGRENRRRLDEQEIEKSDNLEFSLFLILDVVVCKLVFK